MLPNRGKFQRKLSWLRRKYKDGENSAESLSDKKKFQEMSKQLDKIVWFSVPVVYVEFDQDCKTLYKDWSKKKQKRKRVRKRLEKMLDCYDNVYFLTLTYNDKYLNETTQEKRHRDVQAYLYRCTRDYIANIDFGGKNEREHYHAVVALPRSDVLEPWEFGFYKLQPVRRSSAEQEELSKARLTTYLIKLERHATKGDAGRMFSKRGFQKDIDNLPF